MGFENFRSNISWYKFMRSLKTHEYVSKKFLNSQVLSFNQEFYNIMVNKSQIHKELGKFLGILQIWSNQMRNWGEKLGIFCRFGNKTTRWIHRIKIHAIWTSIRGEINEQNLDRKFDLKERENIEKL